MIYFGIPVASEKVLRDWEFSTKLLDNTLRSILNQTDPDLKIIVVCHEVPPIQVEDSRLEIISVDFPRPIYRDEGIVDKHRKREIMACRLRELGGGYLMFVDSDDLISNRLVQFIHEDRSPHGYLLRTGYELDFAKQRVRDAREFYKRSGSCAVLNFTVEDLPETPFQSESCFFRDLINTIHPRWPEWMEAQGRPLKNLPFKGGMYVWNHGQNYSAILGMAGRRRELMRKLQRDLRPSPDIINEFSLALS